MRITPSPFTSRSAVDWKSHCADAQRGRRKEKVVRRKEEGERRKEQVKDGKRKALAEAREISEK